LYLINQRILNKKNIINILNNNYIILFIKFFITFKNEKLKR